MELDELHVHQLGAGKIGEGVAVAGAFPAVAGNPVGAADTAGREHRRFGLEDPETSALPVVAERAADAPAVAQERHDGEFHVDVEAKVDPVVLQRPDHLEARPVANMSQSRVFMTTEIALEDAAVGRAIEEGAPRLELADAVRRFLGVELGHPPVVYVLAAAHRVGEMHLPAIAVVDIRERRRDAAFRHHGVRLAEKRLAEQPDFDPRRRRFDCGAEPGSARSDDKHVEHIVLVTLVTQSSLQSVSTPIEHSRT